MATPRRPRSLPAPKSNPLRDLITQKNRSVEAARERKRVQELKNELPSIIQERVGDQIQKLEDRLLTEVKEIGQRAVEESTAVISQQLNGRIETLEKASAMQTQTLASLSDSSRIAESKVSQVVSQIEQSLASVVPGFALEPSKIPATSMPPVGRRRHPGRLAGLENSLRMPAMPLGERFAFHRDPAPPLRASTRSSFRSRPWKSWLPIRWISPRSSGRTDSARIAPRQTCGAPIESASSSRFCDSSLLHSVPAAAQCRHKFYRF